MHNSELVFSVPQGGLTTKSIFSQIIILPRTYTPVIFKLETSISFDFVAALPSMSNVPGRCHFVISDIFMPLFSKYGIIFGVMSRSIETILRKKKNYEVDNAPHNWEP